MTATPAPQHPAYPPPPEHPEPPRGNGLAIAALVISIISLLFCWVPIINNLFFFTALVSLVLGLVAMRRAKKGRAAGRGLAVAAVIMSVVAVVGVLASQAFYTAVIDEVGESIDEGVAEFEDGLDGDSAKTEEDLEAEQADDTLAIGDVTTAGEYRVLLKGLDERPARTVAEANQFNDQADGEYVIASVATVYDGSEEGDPWLDLEFVLAGADARNYDTSTCDAVVPNEVIDVPTLSNGGQATFNVCFDVPPAALESGAAIYVAESLSFDDERTYWSID